MNQEIEISPCGELLMYQKWYTVDFVQTVIKKKNLKGLKIFDHLDPLDSLDFLSEYTFLERLEIESINDHSYTFLNSLSNLIELSIGAALKASNPIGLSHLTNLVRMALCWRKGKIKGLEDCTSLKEITLIDYKEDDLKPLKNLSNLLSLKIKSSTIKTVTGIEGLKSLIEINLANCRKLESIETANGLLKLKILQLNSCPKVSDYDALTHLPELELLELTDCNKIKSIKFVSNFSNLKKLIILGNTEVVDGDMIPAKEIEDVVYLHRQFYNYKIVNKRYETLVEKNLNRLKNLFK